MSKQLQLELSEIVQLPLSPRALGRLAARQGRGPNVNPFEANTFEWVEWRAGWGLVRGIPDTVHGKSEYLRKEWLRMYNGLAEICDDPTLPDAIRWKARRVLDNSEEQREG